MMGLICLSVNEEADLHVLVQQMPPLSAASADADRPKNCPNYSGKSSCLLRSMYHWHAWVYASHDLTPELISLGH